MKKRIWLGFQYLAVQETDTFPPHGDHLEYSNQWNVQFLQFISMLINTDSLVGAKAYKIKGLFNRSPAILVFS